jgi:hypothetical protein
MVLMETQDGTSHHLFLRYSAYEIHFRVTDISDRPHPRRVSAESRNGLGRPRTVHRTRSCVQTDQSDLSSDRLRSAWLEVRTVHRPRVKTTIYFSGTKLQLRLVLKNHSGPVQELQMAALVTMTWIKPRGPVYACKRVHTHVFFLTFRAGIPAKMVVMIWLYHQWRNSKSVVRPRLSIRTGQEKGFGGNHRYIYLPEPP